VFRVLATSYPVTGLKQEARKCLASTAATYIFSRRW
jgi:hypothetical protein